MRKLDNLYLLDFQECRLKSAEDYNRALGYLFNTRIREFASQYALFVLGDWPTQYYLRQIVYHHLGEHRTSSLSNYTHFSETSDHSYGITTSYPAILGSQEHAPQEHILPEVHEESVNSNMEPVLSIIPTLGALHISLNAQENVLNMYHPLMKYLYESIFPNSKLVVKCYVLAEVSS